MKINTHLKSGCLFVADKLLVAGAKILNVLTRGRPNPVDKDKRLLLYCPNTAGHRLSYAMRMLPCYIDAGYEIFFAYRGPQIYDGKRRPFLKQEPALLEGFTQAKGVHLVQLYDTPRTPRSELASIVQLQREHDISLSIFVDGDELTRPFLWQLLPGTPQFLGRNYAVIIFSEFFYLRDVRWRAFLRRSYRKYLEHGLFIKYIFKYADVLDGAFYADENVIDELQCEKLIHIPELGHSNVAGSESREASRQKEAVAGPYQDFLNTHRGKQIILAFGDLEPRKGFKMLLRLCAEHDELALVRVGRTKPSYHAEWDTILFKEQLEYEKRIFEFDAYVTSQELIDDLFNNVDYVLLPYMDFYRTSSVMIQALSYGKPILVPDVGLMYTRVRRHKLGLWFEHKDYESFVESYSKLRESFATFRPDIENYYRTFHSDEALYEGLRASLPGDVEQED